MKRLRYRTGDTHSAPILFLNVGSPFSHKRIRITFRIDTGADITVTPWRYAQFLELAPKGKVEVGDYDSHALVHESFSVDFSLGRSMFRGVEGIASASGSALLGLDVLNQLKLTLDGPKKQLVIH